jgi:hypothetical protein
VPFQEFGKAEGVDVSTIDTEENGLLFPEVLPRSNRTTLVRHRFNSVETKNRFREEVVFHNPPYQLEVTYRPVFGLAPARTCQIPIQYAKKRWWRDVDDYGF